MHSAHIHSCETVYGLRVCLHLFDYIELLSENKSFPQLIDGQRSSSFACAKWPAIIFVSFIIRSELNEMVGADLNGMPCIVRNALISTYSTNANCHKCVIYYFNWKFYTKERAIDS